MRQLRLDYDDAGNYRIVCETTGKKGEWVSYQSVAKLIDGEYEYVGFSEYWGELSGSVYGLYQSDSKVETVLGIKPE